MILKNGKRMDTVLDNLPIGTINCFGSSVAPTGWLICDGSAISRTIYSELFSVIGTTYGTGDGSTTFNLPDYRGKIGVGYSNGDTDFGTLGKTGGEKTHQLTINEMPSHSHGFSKGASNKYENIYISTNGDWNTPSSGSGFGFGAGYMTISNSGGDQPHNNLQPYITINYIIKVYMVIPVNSSVYNALDSTSTTDALSANQGKVLNDKINGNTLWTNPSPNSSFAEQTIAISTLSNYRYIEIECIKNTSDLQVKQIAKLNYAINNSINIFMVDSGVANKIYLRDFTITSSTTINISAAYTPGVGYYNDKNIPIKIIGYI